MIPPVLFQHEEQLQTVYTQRKNFGPVTAQPAMMCLIAKYAHVLYHYS